MVMNLLHRWGWRAPANSRRLLDRWLPLAAAGLVFALGWLILQPEWQRLSALQQRAHLALSREHEAKAAEAGSLASLQGRLEEARQQLQDARWRLAAGDGMSDLLDQLAASAHAYGLQFEQLDARDALKQAGYLQTPLDMHVVGRYAALRMWLEGWLGQTRLLRAGDFQLAEAGDRPGLLRLQLRVYAYQADAPVPMPRSLGETPARAQVQPPPVDPFSGWSTRVAPQGLANVPLAQMQMVGSLATGLDIEALVVSAGRLHRVRVGDRLGRDEGVVMQVSEQQIGVQERLYMGGAWRERTALLTLRKGVDMEVTEDEMADEVGSGGTDAGRTGDGSTPSG